MSAPRQETQQERISREIRELELENARLRREFAQLERAAEASSHLAKLDSRRLELENGMLKAVVSESLGRQTGSYVIKGIEEVARGRVQGGERGGGARPVGDRDERHPGEEYAAARPEHEEPADGGRAERTTLVARGSGDMAVAVDPTPVEPGQTYKARIFQRPIRDNPQA